MAKLHLPPRVMMMALTCCLPLLAACSTPSLTALRQSDPSLTPYNRALAGGYLGLAEESLETHDRRLAERYAERGLLANHGRTSEPVLPDAALANTATGAEMLEARSRLQEAINTDNMFGYPQLTADALIYFDCWVWSKEERLPDSTTQHCRDAFYDHLATLSRQEKEELTASPPESMIEPEIIQLPVLPGDENRALPQQLKKYTVRFSPGHASLSDRNMRIIHIIAANLEPINDYRIILIGHSDSPGPAGINANLALNRARQTAQALVAEGVDKEAISVFSFGEFDPLFSDTEDKGDDRNRRVEIYISG